MKRTLFAVIVAATCHNVTANEPSAECLTAYSEIKHRLETEQITLSEAQELWLEHKKSHGITSKTEVITESSEGKERA